MSFRPVARGGVRARLVRGAGPLLGGTALCAGVWGVWALLAQNLALVLLAHFLAAAAGGAAGAAADRRRLGAHFFPWILALTVPLFGGSAAWFLMEATKRRRTGRLAEEYAAYLNDAASFRESVPVHEISAPGDPLYLIDVLEDPASNAEQRIAIEYLADLETPDALDILRKAASSSGSEAYFFAMTALTQMEDRMLARLGDLENSLRQGGESRADAELLLKTAAAYIDFVYYRFAEGERRVDCLHRAQALLERALASPSAGESEINRALILSGRVRLGLEDGGGAAQFFSRYIERNPARSRGYLWRAEAWHQLGEYARLREDLRAAREIGGVPGVMRPVLDYWLQEKTDDEAGADL